MALSTGDGTGLRRGRRRGRSRKVLSEINVTPMVDVMLVLLIIFMISAPLLTNGVQVDLPKTEAGAVKDQAEPLNLSIRKDGTIFVKDTQVDYDQLSQVLGAISGAVRDKPIFVRADGAAPYEAVARVMAKLSTSGYSKINLITDTAASAPPAGAGLKPLAKPAAAP